MSEPEEFYLDGPNFIESSEFEESIGDVLERLDTLEKKLIVTQQQPSNDIVGTSPEAEYVYACTLR